MPSDWTVDTLHEHLRALMVARDDQMDRRAATAEARFSEHLAEVRHETDLALQASQAAIAKSESMYEKRFDAVDEFRAQISDQQKSYMTRSEYQGAHAGLVDGLAAHAHDDEVQHHNLNEKIGNAVSQALEGRDQLQRQLAAANLQVSELRTRLTTTSNNRALILTIIGLILTLTIVAVSFYAATKK